MERFVNLRNKEVINLYDGVRMGYVYDVELDPLTGFINAIIIPRKTSFFGLFCHNEEYIIPWSKITKIGDDIIFVEFCL